MSRVRDVRDERHSVVKLDSDCDDQKNAKFFSAAVMRFLRTEETLAVSCAVRVAPGEVHVWPLSLDSQESIRGRFAALLDQAEQQRAARYYHERDRHAFVLARGQMRYLLARYCDVGAASIRFVASPSGKPRLAADLPCATRISFNLSHSGGRALLAVTDGAELGVDLECHDRKTDVLSLAEHYFSVPEREAVASAEESARVTTFFRIWTGKEAVIKAHGEGLGIPLDAFSVAHAITGEDFARVKTFSEARLDEGWFVRPLPCERGWSAALAGRAPLQVQVMGQS